HPIMCGHAEGTSTFAPAAPSPELLSPEAAKITQPLSLAAWAAASTWSSTAGSQASSSLPQLIDRTSQPAATAAFMTAANEASSLGAKNMLIVGTWPVQKKYAAAATWMSSKTSPSASPPGLFCPPFTGTSVGRICGSPLSCENMSRSDWWYPPPSSRIPIVPPPARPVGKLYAVQR